MKNLILVSALTGLMIITILLLPNPAPTVADQTSTAEPQSSVVISNVRVFDGEQIIESATLIASAGMITAVGPDLEIPSNAEVIDGSGHTLIPGLIDSHVHVYGTAQAEALRFGVTTMLDMFTAPAILPEARKQRESLAKTDQADLFSAGYLATVEGGHGSQFGISVPTLSSPDQAEQWVADRIAEGSDYIKIIIEDGQSWGRALPTLDAATVVALTQAAQAQGLMAVAHVSTMAGAEMALDAGVDGLVHLFADQAIDPDWIARAAEANLWVAPTTTVLAGAHGQSGADWLSNHPVLGPRLTPVQLQSLEMSFPGSNLRSSRWPLVMNNLSALHQAGIRILAGSDAPNPGTAHGASQHHEIKLLIESGLTPIEALASATSIPAQAFGLDDGNDDGNDKRGCLNVGCRADMVLLDGNPFTDSNAISAVVGVWKNGYAVEIELPASPEIIHTGEPAEPVDLLKQSDRWMVSTDQFMGGSSVAEQAWQEQGNGQGLMVAGELREGSAFRYAGSMWMANSIPMQANDFSGHRELQLKISGDQSSYQIMFFSGEDMGSMPVTRNFNAEQLAEGVTIPLASLAGANLSMLRAIGIFAYEQPGTFELTIEQAELN